MEEYGRDEVIGLKSWSRGIRYGGGCLSPPFDDEGQRVCGGGQHRFIGVDARQSALDQGRGDEYLCEEPHARFASEGLYAEPTAATDSLALQYRM